MRSSAIFLVSVVTSTRSPPHPVVDLLHQIVDLALGRLDDHLRVDQPGRPHHLLDDLARHLAFVRARRGRQEHHLVHALHELFEPQRAVVGGGREPETVTDQRLLAGTVALVLAMQLRHRHVALVEHDEEVVREEVEQGVRRLATAAAVDRARVVLDAVAEQHVVEVRDDVVRVRLLVVRRHDRVRDARQPADYEHRDEPDGEQHRRLRIESPYRCRSS